MTRRDEVWKERALVQSFLTGVRGAIPHAETQVDAMLRVIAATGLPVERILDLGAGDGVLSAALLARYPHATATLVDFSAPMLAAARDRLLSRTPGTRFVDADFSQPGWANAVADGAPFDVVVSGYAIHHQPDERKQTLYGEIFALLTPGGVFINVEHVASATEWLEQIFDDLMIDAMTDFHQRGDGSRTRAEVVSGHHQRPDKAANVLAPVEVQCGWLRAIGFEDVDCYVKLFELAVFGGRRPAA